MNIGENDLKRKIKQAQGFLEKKLQVRIVPTVHGRQLFHPERTLKFLDEIKVQLEEYGTLANVPSEKNMSLVFNPKSDN